MKNQPRLQSDSGNRQPATLGTIPLFSGESFLLTFAKPTPCSGFDLIPAAKRDRMEGWRVEYRLTGSNDWTLLRSLDRPLANTYAISDGRLEKTWKRGLRLRFAPVAAAQWRFTRTSPSPVTLGEVMAVSPK